MAIFTHIVHSGSFFTYIIKEEKYVVGHFSPILLYSGKNVADF